MKVSRIRKIFILSFPVMILCGNLAAQEKTIKYNAFYNGNHVGQVNLYQNRSGEALHLKMVTDITVKMMLEVNVKIVEESNIDAGKLISSKLNRVVNGKEKANRQTIASGNVYHTIAEGQKGVLQMARIDYNLIQLYCFEPVNQTKVYSDNFQQFVTIKTIASHVYRIDLPDGNYNEFTYSKGVCTYVSIHSNLFTIVLKLA